jgi:N-acetylated-alpha-linked acidic dipeptidase
MKNLIICCTLLLATIASQGQESILGFTPENAAKQKQLEAEFEKKLNAGNLDEWMQKMAAEPHWVGTPYGAELAQWMQKKFTSWVMIPR